ncbi:WXG100 family type VII secretion target [Amycolatopsis samaneae]
MSEREGATESIAHPLASALPSRPSAFSGLNALGGAAEIEVAAGPYLAFLSELADELGLIDPVEAYFRPLVGQWDVLGAEADGLRQAAGAAGAVSDQLADDLGRLDAGWSGADADAFITYMGEVGAAGGDVGDALSTLAGALDELVSAVRHIVVDLAEVLVDTAEVASESALLPVGGTTRTRAQVQEAQQTAKALYEAARDVMEAFGRLCDGVDDPDVASRSIEIAHRYPQERFRLHDADGGPAAEAQPAPQARTGGSDAGSTTPSAAHDGAEGRHTGARDQAIEQGQSTGAGVTALGPAPAAPSAEPGHNTMGMPMVPMGLGGMGAGGGAKQRQPKQRSAAKVSDVFGEPAQVVPPVIGEEEPKPTPKPPPPK